MVSNISIKLSFLTIFLALFTDVNAQENPNVHYSFNACSLMDETAIFPNASMTSLNCACGVEDTSVVFTGNETLVFPDETKSLLENDYSISFYFKSDNLEPTVSLLSLRKVCDQDSMLTIKYSTTNDEVEVSMSESNSSFTRIRGEVNPDLCWHYVVVVKAGLNLSLYLDNEFILTEPLPFDIPFTKLASLSISDSPCIGISEDPLNGRIDDFKIFDRAISRREINAAYFSPAQILNRDTTIFLGDFVEIFTGNNCSPSIEWTPDVGLDDNTISSPIASPLSTTNYQVSFQGDGCDQTDDFTIYVLDKKDLRCDSLLLPNAFTPNNDSVNDLYGISNRFVIESLDLFEIYDRWGGLVFNTNDKNIKWDGSINGQEPNPGMYLYKVNYTCQGEEFTSVGNFSLIR